MIDTSIKKEERLSPLPLKEAFKRHFYLFLDEPARTALYPLVADGAAFDIPGYSGPRGDEPIPQGRVQCA
jgi:hypothetical protein